MTISTDKPYRAKVLGGGEQHFATKAEALEEAQGWSHHYGCEVDVYGKPADDGLHTHLAFFKDGKRIR